MGKQGQGAGGATGIPVSATTLRTKPQGLL